MTKLPKGLYWRGTTIWAAFQRNGKRFAFSTGTGLPKLAEDILAEKKVEFLKNKHGFEKKSVDLTITEFYEWYKVEAWNGRRTKALKGTLKYLWNMLNWFVSKHGNDFKITDLKTLHIEEYRRWRKSHGFGNRASVKNGVSPATVNRELCPLKRSFNLWNEVHADEEHLQMRNPVELVKFYNERSRCRTRFLSSLEKSKLLPILPLALYRAVVTALNTGMRQGEILRIRWVNIDYENRTILVRENKEGDIPKPIPMTDELIALFKSIPSTSEWLFALKSGKKPVWDCPEYRDAW